MSILWFVNHYYSNISMYIVNLLMLLWMCQCMIINAVNMPHFMCMYILLDSSNKKKLTDKDVLTERCPKTRLGVWLNVYMCPCDKESGWKDLLALKTMGCSKTHTHTHTNNNKTALVQSVTSTPRFFTAGRLPPFWPSWCSYVGSVLVF